MRRRTVLLSLGALAACARRSDGEGGPTGDTVTVRGSDTMVILAQRWAEAFMKRNPSLAIQVSGGGSGVGLTALIDGTTDIANASRGIKDSERERIQERYGEAVVETPVAIDTVAMYVHRDNPIASLSLDEAKRMFRGQVEHWHEVGPDIGWVILYSRENNSGTYAFFKEEVLDHLDFAAEAQTLPGTAAVINAVSKDTGAVGYGGIGFGEGVRVVPIRLEDGSVVKPSSETARNGQYPLARPLFMYTVGEPDGLARQFIDFVLSDNGQALVEELGYFPLPKTA